MRSNRRVSSTSDVSTSGRARSRPILRWAGILVAAAFGAAAPTVALPASPAVAVPATGTAGGWAWGSNVDGRLGNGTTTGSAAPVAVSELSNVTAIAAGSLHGIALESDGTVWAWGNNDGRQLGGGVTNNASYTPVLVNPLTEVTAIAAGALHSLALRSDGTVWAWGRNDHGQLGIGATSSFSAGPVQVSGLTGVTAIAAGGKFSLAVGTDGTVWAWGENLHGQLGDGTTTNSSTPAPVSGLTGATAVAAGGSHSLALLTDGTALAWGSVDEDDPDFGVDVRCGQLGHGILDGSATPVAVAGLTGITMLAAGNDHSLAVTDDGTAWAWGCNERGQLGDGTTTDSLIPVAVPGLAGVTAVAGGYFHSLAALSDGTVRAWGHNNLGQLGDGTTTDSTTPVTVAGLTGATAVSANSSFSQAIAPTVPASISGTVLEEGTNAVIAGRVCVDAERTSDGAGAASTLTDTDTGTYTLGDLGPGSYRVRFRDCNGTLHVGEYHDDSPTAAGATTLTLVAGQHRTGIDATLTVTPTASISGTVLKEGTDAVIAGQICVDAQHSADGAVARSTLTDAGTGDFTLGDLAAGSYRVRFHDCNGTQHSGEYYDDSPTPSGATLITLTNGEARTAVDARLAAAHRLTLVAVDGAGAPVAGVCFATDGSWFCDDGSAGDTADDGTVVVELLPGTYEVQAFDYGHVQPAPQTVDLTADTTLTFTMPRLATVTVDLTDGASGCFSLYLPFFIEEFVFWSPGPTACDHESPGTVKFGPVEPGDYRLAGYGTSGEDPPFRDVTVGSADLRIWFPGDGPPPPPSPATVVVESVVQTDTVTGPGGTYAPGNATVLVTVREADGSPIAGRRVHADADGANPASGSAVTDADGIATVPLQPAREGDDYYALHPGTDTVVACDDPDADERCDAGELTSAPATIEWQGLAPSNVTVERSSAQAPGFASVLATARDDAGNVVPNRHLAMLVAGPNAQAGQRATTDANGVATFAYPADGTGTDTVTVCDDTDGDRTCDPEEPAAAPLTVQWVTSGTTEGARFVLERADGSAAMGMCVALVAPDDVTVVARTCDRATGTDADGTADGVAFLAAPRGLWSATFTGLPAGHRAPDAVAVTVPLGGVAERTVVVRQRATIRVTTIDEFGGERLSGCFVVLLPAGYAPTPPSCADAATPARVPVVMGELTVVQTSSTAGHGLAAPIPLAVATTTVAVTVAAPLTEGLALTVVDETGAPVRGTCWSAGGVGGCDRATVGTGRSPADGRIALPPGPGTHELQATTVPTSHRSPRARSVTVSAGEVTAVTVVVHRKATVSITTRPSSGSGALAGACYEVTLPEGYDPVTGCAASTSPLVLPIVRGTIVVTQTAAPPGRSIAPPQTLTVTGGNANLTFRNGT